MSTTTRQQLVNIPTVTEEDLRAFHERHYSDAPAPKELFVGPDVDQEISDQHEDPGEQDDGLGYYDDGVKRTLSDAQVALFRHTEVHKVIRERRRALEREAEEEDEKPYEHHQHSSATSPAGLRGPVAAVPVPSSATNQQSSGVSKKKRKNKNKRRNKSDLDRPEGSGQGMLKKAKWAHYIPEDGNNPGSYTHRRLAREMDSVPTVSAGTDLMYGEEEDDDDVATVRVTAAAAAEQPPKADVERRLTSYGD